MNPELLFEIGSAVEPFLPLIAAGAIIHWHRRSR